MNGGGVRNPGFTFAQSAAGEGDGNVTYGEAFAVQPFGNSLVTMTLIAQDLKDVLEEQFAGCRGQSATATRLMLPAAHVAMACAQTDDASLAGGDTDAAEAAFERAGIIEHAADAEMGLVRACMQPGRYRRALTFVAHTAGVHPTDPRVALDGIYETAMRVALQVLAAR